MLVELKEIKKKYQHPTGNGDVYVLKGINLQVQAGESIAIIGPSGSGKTTLLNIIGALDPPTSGSVNFSGRDMTTLSDMELSILRNREIGFVFQLHHLLPQCTVLENVLIPTIAFGPKKIGKEALIRAKNMLERVGMGNHLDHFPAQLSGGELQRTAFVRALINRPKLILADEPTGSLDRKLSESLNQLLVQLNEEEATALIVVTHSLELAQLMKRGYSLQNGRLINDPQIGVK